MKHLAYYCHLEILGAIFSGCRDSNVIIKFVNLGKYIQLVYQQHLCQPLKKKCHIISSMIEPIQLWKL